MTLTQPWATLITGILAVLAATIAYRGVLKNLREQRKTEHRNHVISQLIDTASEIATLEANVYKITAKRRGGELHTEEDAQRLSEVGMRLMVAATKLELFELTDASKAVEAYALAVTKHASTRADANTSKAAVEAKDHVLTALVMARKTVEKR